MERLVDKLFDTIVNALFWGSYYYYTAKIKLQKRIKQLVGNTDKFSCSEIANNSNKEQ